MIPALRSGLIRSGICGSVVRHWLLVIGMIQNERANISAMVGPERATCSNMTKMATTTPLVAPTEVEGLLMEDEAVSDCAVVGFADNDGVVRPKAFIVLRSGLRPSLDIEERLKRMVAERWPDLPHKQLGAVEFASSLPRSSTGKLQRFRLRPATLTEFSYEC